MPVLGEGDKIVVIERRLFRDDNTRMFVAAVEKVEQEVIVARGFSIHVSPYEVTGTERRGEERVRLIALSAGDVIYLLPREQDLSKLQLKRSPKSMQLTDGRYAMDLSDFMLRA